MTTALCVESKRRYPLATIYVPVYFPYSCSVHPLWRSGALPSRENEEASGPETLREGRVGRVGTFHSGSSKSSLQHILTYLPSYCKNNICDVWVVYPETVTNYTYLLQTGQYGRNTCGRQLCTAHHCTCLAEQTENKYINNIKNVSKYCILEVRMYVCKNYYTCTYPKAEWKKSWDNTLKYSKTVL